MKTEFEARYPAVIRFGCGVRRELPARLGAWDRGAPPRVFLVAARSLLEAAPGRDLADLCGAGAPCAIFSGVPHDPPLATVDAIIAALRASGARAVVAAGGGSVLDAAKAAAAVAPHGASVEPFFRGARSLPGPGLPLLALPTTAGSGAEITANAVLTDPAGPEKKSLRSPHVQARVALVDPELTLSMSPALTAHSGLDALTQAVESYISAHANALTRPLAAAATGRLFAHLPAAVRDGGDRAARTAVAEGSLLSAMAFSQSGLGAVHGLAHPLGLALNLPHGLVCAILLPAVLRWNLPVAAAALEQLAPFAGAADAEGFVLAVARLCAELGVPRGLAGSGLRAEHTPYVLAHCRSASMQANPRPMADADVAALLRFLAET